jgi:hypothetical protein
MRRRILTSLLALTLLTVVFPVQSFAQAEEGALSLELNRVFGFRFMNRIQGNYNFVVKGPDDLERVEILIDGEVRYEIAEPPFKLGFSTSDISPGLHSFSVVGYTTDGRTLQAEAGAYTVLSAEEAQEGITKYFLPIIIGIFVLIALAGMLSGVITGRRGKVRIGEYGAAGGAVCKRCGLPFSRNILSPNLVVGKLERCPNCGAIAIVRRGSAIELQEAEQRLLASMQVERGERGESEEDRLRRMIDDSRFEDF